MVDREIEGREWKGETVQHYYEGMEEKGHKIGRKRKEGNIIAK